jgi:hypothetical protein
MFWKDTKTPEEAKSLRDRMWGLERTAYNDGRIEWRVRGEGLYQNGEFWFDAIRKVRAWPHERLRMAEEHLPLPAAFQEAAVALRAIVRAHRVSGGEYGEELERLHKLAAIWSFYIPYAPRLQQPGGNVMERVPFAEFLAMDLSWNTIGCDRLSLLAKIDRRLMVTAWGEPKAHTTAHAQYQSVWDRYEDLLLGERRANHQSRPLV